jgi:hypothetical protein
MERRLLECVGVRIEPEEMRRDDGRVEDRRIELDRDEMARVPCEPVPIGGGYEQIYAPTRFPSTSAAK